MILIAGATGSNGSELARLLSSRGIRVRAMVRSRESAKSIAALPGVELVLADFDDQGTVERALDGIEKAFLVTNSSERAEAQQRAFIETAGRAGLKHIVNPTCAESTVEHRQINSLAEKSSLHFG